MSKPTLQQEKIAINNELRTCANFLQDRETKLPSHLQQTDLSVLSTQEQVKLLNARMLEITQEEHEIAVAKKEAIAKSKDIIIGFKNRIFEMQQEINDVVGTLDGSHKGYLFELEQALNRQLRGYKPAVKSKSKKAS